LQAAQARGELASREIAVLADYVRALLLNPRAGSGRTSEHSVPEGRSYGGHSPRVLVVGCGALARELVDLTRGLPNVDITCLPATLHNRPGGIPEAVRERIRTRRAGYDRVFQVDKQDFSIPWNLGWAKYLVGDYAGSLEATNAALKLTPDRFTLFLNRALVQLAQGDATAARASVETGLDTAAAAGLGSQGTFFAEGDFEIGRLAELRPNEAVVLRVPCQMGREQLRRHRCDRRRLFEQKPSAQEETGEEEFGPEAR